MSERVSEQFLNSTSARSSLYSAILKVHTKYEVFTIGLDVDTNKI